MEGPMDDRTKNQVVKSMLADSGEQTLGGLVGYRPTAKLNDRGIDIYNLSELQGVSGRDQYGRMTMGTIQRPIFSLSIEDRQEMFRRSGVLQGVVTSRAKRVSALKWNVSYKDRDYKRDIAEMLEYKEMFDEYKESSDLRAYAVRYKIRQTLTSKLPELLPDMENFDGALRRYKKRIERKNEDKSTEIENWLKEPSQGVTFPDFLHKLVVDLMIHGNGSVYKQWQSNAIENFYLLPGGTIFPYRQLTIGGPEVYFQIIPSMEPKAYFNNEITYMRYVPVSWLNIGECPLEALINKIAETLLFDKRAADQADGTKPPEKAVAFGKTPSPMGGLTDNMFEMPLAKEEQKRIETKLNEARKEAIITLSGMGTPTVIDLSKADTFGAQQGRQDKILRDVALIYNMTNMEVNLAGGEFTSGKETSDVQKEIEQEKGIGPIIKMIERTINDDIIPYRYGYDYEFSFDVGLSESEQVELDQKKINTGTYSVNEVRESRGDDVFPEDEYNRPSQQGSTQPDGSSANPFNMSGEVKTL